MLWQDGEYRISSVGADDECELSLGTALDVVFARLHAGAMERFCDHTRIHAASGIGPDGMVLLVGEKRSGKTTLTVHLMLQGFDMVGDEMVLLRQGRAITFPRRFYLRDTSFDLLPGLGDRLADVPTLHAGFEGRLVPIDPLSLGRPWRIRPAPVAVVVFLEANHGGASWIAACPKVEMVRRVLVQSSPPSSGRKDWLADLCRTINHATTVTAQLGDLHAATDSLRRFLS